MTRTKGARLYAQAQSGAAKEYSRDLAPRIGRIRLGAAPLGGAFGAGSRGFSKHAWRCPEGTREGRPPHGTGGCSGTTLA